MKNVISKFTFPYAKQVLIVSVIALLTLLAFPYLINLNNFDKYADLFRVTMFVSTFIAMLGFSYYTLALHFKTLRGDELKLRIHLEALNIAFTSTIITLFVLIFVFINFSPLMLNWIMLILVIVAIISYLIASKFVEEKYK